MSKEDLLEKIESDAQLKIKDILRERDDEVSSLKKSYEEKIKRIKEEHHSSLGEMKRKEKEKNISKLNRFFREEKEKIKREFVDKVFCETLNQLKNITDDEYYSLMKSFLEKNIDREFKGECLVPKKRKEVSERIIKDIALPVSVKETDDICGGFILFDDSMHHDLSFESLMSAIQEDLEVEVSKKLFS